MISQDTDARKDLQASFGERLAWMDQEREGARAARAARGSPPRGGWAPFMEDGGSSIFALYKCVCVCVFVYGPHYG